MRRPQWQERGSEPDYRFSLANERTFLAWIRTALAILAGGVLLHQFAGHIGQRNLLVDAAIALSVLGAVIAGGAYFRWKTNEIAMRNAGPLPLSIGIPLLSAAILCVATSLTIGILY